MKTKLFKLMTFFLVISMISCSKEDTTEQTTPITQDGGAIRGSQIVTVTFNNITLTQFEYQGTIGGIPVNLVKTGEHTLAFYLPNEVLTGAHDLIIPGLSNATVHYNISPTSLTGTADENVVDLFANLNAFAQTLNNDPQAVSAQNAINTLITHYNNASAAEKASIATLYKANKQLFDHLILTDFSDITGRNTVTETKIHINKHVAAIALVGVAALGVATSPVLGCAILAVAGYKAYEANTEALANIYDKNSAIVFGWFSNKNNVVVNRAPEIVLTDNIAKELTFEIKERKLIASDASKTEPLAVKYFNSVNLYNHIVTKNNPLINQTNTAEHTDFDTLTQEVLQTSNPDVINPVDSSFMENVEFSSSNSNVSVVSAALSSNGQLNLKLKLNGTPTALPVRTNLHISYNDGFSSFSGNIPVTVEASLVGTWTLVSFEDGVPLGTYVDLFTSPSCPSVATQAYTALSETLIIGENTYSFIEKDKYKFYNRSILTSNCSIETDAADTFETYTDTGSGTYVLDGNTFTATSSNDEVVTHTIQFITINKVKVGDRVYVR
ncbi:hypothetical protein FEDK69T_10850 [Flavobacterium enshiense DK69]|uniref:Bacterial Ig-like domain-containing protein n=1 Tax=Flavobacterium enshiense DK69 TaxID=1107311 RepID=V6SBT8_9FLAO|nr:hypothetical protein [Flavobacterium enshiense]ESU23682.1 hypothetical protein FEDK69T_10850 [Flavobacterium enshiense DK69]KGO96187.1 hypothetical protein Q767_08015 [Flavobacterium enshiense DK69]